MVEIVYNQEQLDSVVNNLNALELAPNRNITNAQRVMEIFNILSAGVILPPRESTPIEDVKRMPTQAVSEIPVEEVEVVTVKK